MEGGNVVCSDLALLKFSDCWNESGGKWSPENDSPAAAAAWRCSKAAECSWALRLSSATEVDLRSAELIEFNEETITAAAVVAVFDKWLQSLWAFSLRLPYGEGVFNAQHEQKLVNPKTLMNMHLKFINQKSWKVIFLPFNPGNIVGDKCDANDAKFVGNIICELSLSASMVVLKLNFLESE